MDHIHCTFSVPSNNSQDIMHYNKTMFGNKNHSKPIKNKTHWLFSDWWAYRSSWSWAMYEHRQHIRLLCTLNTWVANRSALAALYSQNTHSYGFMWVLRCRFRHQLSTPDHGQNVQQYRFSKFFRLPLPFGFVVIVAVLVGTTESTAKMVSCVNITYRTFAWLLIELSLLFVFINPIHVKNECVT